MEIYKKGQGTVVRICAYIAAFFLLFYGCYSLYRFLVEFAWGRKLLFELSSPHLSVRLAWVPSVAIFLMVGWLIHRYVNRARQADFLIETEGELKKVSWPPRKDYMSASSAVIVLLIFAALFLYGVDWMLTNLMRSVGLGF